MSESQDLEPNRPPPIAPGSPENPLPRLWKYNADDEPGEDEAEADTNGPSAAKTKKKEAQPEPAGDPVKPKASRKRDADKKRKQKDAGKTKGKDGKEKGVLLEETPTLDTYETRTRVRIVVGVAAVSIVFLLGWIIVWAFSPPASPPEEPIPQEMLVATGTAADPRERAEQEGRILLDRAKEFAKNNKNGQAIAMLKRVTTAYPNSQASVEAKQALDRTTQRLPLFRPAVVASGGEQPPPPANPQPEGPVIDATKTNVGAASNAEAKLVLPSNIPASARVSNPVEQPKTRPLPAGFHPRAGSRAHDSGWPLEIVGDRDPEPMLLVPGGTFIQGRDDADSAEGPMHNVQVATFYMDKHEVTVRQFNRYQRETGKRLFDRERALARDSALKNLDADDDLPVVMVSAREASDYSYWAGKRLPTEAQWEASARSPDGRIYPWGPSPPSWSKPREYKQIDPVMSFPSDVSPYGVFDLAGNAWEWTKDWFDARYYQQFRTTTADNPTGPAARARQKELVVKGTSKDWCVSKREGMKWETRLPYLGFRCVLQVEGPGNAFEPPPGASQPAAGAGAAGQAGGSTVPF
jgi:formylglycine-generating enzyme required for sulfatase activity